HRLRRRAGALWLTCRAGRRRLGWFEGGRSGWLRRDAGAGGRRAAGWRGRLAAGTEQQETSNERKESFHRPPLYQRAAIARDPLVTPSRARNPRPCATDTSL